MGDQQNLVDPFCYYYFEKKFKLMHMNNKRLLSLLWTIAIAFLFIACSSDSKDDEPKPRPINPEIKIEGEDPTLGSLELNSSLTFTSNSDWTAETIFSSNDKWFTISPSRGKAGTVTIAITASKNSEYSDRNAIVKISAGTATRNVTVTQKKMAALLISKDKYEIESAGGEITIEVQANVDYTISIPEDSYEWIKHNIGGNTKSLSSYQESFTISKAPIGESRIGQIIFSNGIFVETVRIFQEELNGIILNTKEVNLTRDQQSFDVELKTNVDYEIIIPAATNWIKPAQTKSLRVDKASFDVDENISPESRSGKIVFLNRTYNISDTLTVKQTGKEVLYESTDYSQDGVVLTWQKATRGNGIDLVFMGDGYVDRDMNPAGKYEQTMRNAVEYFFSVEPTKSYREYFNVYVVKVVSKNEVFTNESQTALEVTFGDGTYVYGEDKICISYLNKTPITNIDNTLTTIVVNENKYAGTCGMYSNGAAFAYLSKISELDFQETLLHEALGHGFGKLADEYYYSRSGRIPQEEIEDAQSRQNKLGWYANVDFTNDPTKIRWAHFLSSFQFSSYTDSYEGGYLYEKGVWRPEANSCMRYNDLYFNAPSREAIVKRIKELAGETYSWDEFITKDKYEPIKRTKSDIDRTRLHTPPIFKEGSPK